MSVTALAPHEQPRQLADPNAQVNQNGPTLLEKTPDLDAVPYPRLRDGSIHWSQIITEGLLAEIGVQPTGTDGASIVRSKVNEAEHPRYYVIDRTTDPAEPAWVSLLENRKPEAQELLQNRKPEFQQYRTPNREDFIDGTLDTLAAAYDLPLSVYDDTKEQLNPAIYEQAWSAYWPRDSKVLPKHLPTLLTYLDTYLTARRELQDPVALSVNNELARKIHVEALAAQAREQLARRNNITRIGDRLRASKAAGIMKLGTMACKLGGLLPPKPISRDYSPQRRHVQTAIQFGH